MEQEATESRHIWKSLTVFAPTFCEHCTKALWGLAKQGVKCKKCNKILHEKCTAAEEFCNPHEVNPKTANTRDGHPHEFFSKFLSKPSFCGVCRYLIFGVNRQGLCCGVCRFIAHHKCQEKVPNNCRVSYQAGPIPRHHWVEGNLHQSITQPNCLVCSEATSSTAALADFHCAWCNVTVHSKCFAKVNEVCSLGPFKKILVSPLDVLNEEAGLAIKPDIQNVPLICFVNRKSGGGQGAVILRKLRHHLNPVQIFDLADGGPAPGIRKFAEIPSYVLVCGGDGTVNWVLETIRSIQPRCKPAVGVLPLGTGNDMARVLGWGGGYADESIDLILREFLLPVEVMMDRWQLSKRLPDGTLEPVNVMNNYFSIGIDAKVLHDFHTKREANPQLFTSRSVNKMWYGKYSIQALGGGMTDFHQVVEVEIDGRKIPIDDSYQGLLLCNVPSYAAGTDVWGKGKDVAENTQWRPQSFNDGLLELVAVTGITHMAAVVGNVASALRLGQGSEIVFTLRGKEMPVQIDGEPWVEETECVLVFRRLEQATMLSKKV